MAKAAFVKLTRPKVYGLSGLLLDISYSDFLLSMYSRSLATSIVFTYRGVKCTAYFELSKQVNGGENLLLSGLVEVGDKL